MAWYNHHKELQLPGFNSVNPLQENLSWRDIPYIEVSNKKVGRGSEYDRILQLSFVLHGKSVDSEEYRWFKQNVTSFKYTMSNIHQHLSIEWGLNDLVDPSKAMEYKKF